MKSDRPKVGVGAYIFNDGKVLMAERLNANHANHTFAAPGGHVEFGETWGEAAMREAKEETGLTTANPRFIGITNDVWADERKHYITIAVALDYVGGEPQIMEPEKSMAWKWLTLDEVKNLDPKMVSLENFLDGEFADNLVQEIEKSKGNKR
ncbi:MAG: NUDIX domain-containing protein [Candidatus Nomurabacteria bacterium]|jgi:8-oxo-dGTP diphosphatase|nr:NUDIX domain-containing protein [Candidatus Nomurabacteria bacterium]